MKGAALFVVFIQKYEIVAGELAYNILASIERHPEVKKASQGFSSVGVIYLPVQVVDVTSG